MMNWAEHEDPHPQRKTVSPYWAIAAAIVAVGLALWSGKLWADPMFSATAEGATVALIPIQVFRRVVGA